MLCYYKEIGEWLKMCVIINYYDLLFDLFDTSLCNIIWKIFT